MQAMFASSRRAASGIGRATAVAAAANNLLTVGLDLNEEEAKRPSKWPGTLGGRMVFIPTDLTRDEDIEHAVVEAAKLGTIRYVANIAGIQHIDSVDNFPMEKYDLMQKIMLRAPFLSVQADNSPHEEEPIRNCVIGNMASVHGHICTVNKPVVQHHEIRPEGSVSVHFC